MSCRAASICDTREGCVPGVVVDGGEVEESVPTKGGWGL